MAKIQSPPLPEPIDNPVCCAKPHAAPLEFIQKTNVKVAPQSFGRETSRVPEDRQDPAILCGVVKEKLAEFPGNRFRQRHMSRVEQGCVLKMERQFEEMTSAGCKECLNSSSAVSDPVVVPERRVVVKSGFFEHARRRFIEAQPVHSHTEVGIPCGSFNSAMLVTAFLNAVPCVNAVYSDFVAHVHQFLQQWSLFAHVIGRRPPLRMRLPNVVAGTIFEWY